MIFLYIFLYFIAVFISVFLFYAFDPGSKYYKSDEEALVFTLSAAWPLTLIGFLCWGILHFPWKYAKKTALELQEKLRE